MDYHVAPIPLTLQQAVDDWCDERIRVYRASSDQIRVDANSAAAVAKDHVDRWLLELIQNAEDAGATRVKVKITSSTIYLADNGHGLSAASVRAISALHLSDKPTQAIGRKGLGFKAVYCVADEPAIFTGEDGIHFNENHARQFLSKHGFDEVKKVPYSWLPLWRARADDEAADGELATLREFHTVVRLPLRERVTAQSSLAQARKLEAHTLLTFRHLRHVRIASN